MLVDVHAHLTDPRVMGRLGTVMSSATAAGVWRVVTCGIGPEDSRAVLRLVNGQVRASLGIAPYDLRGYEEVLELIERNPGSVDAVGEVGLDLYRGSRETLEEQVRAFKEFIRLARSLDKPIVVHSRNAGKLAIEVLMQEGAERVVMHAYDGDVSAARRGAERGFRFSIPPRIAESDQKKSLVRRLPLEALLLETDSPWLGPSRSSINEPKNVWFSVEWIARIKSVSPQRVVEVTYRNALETFGWTD
ncbi:MAG: TatD family hydrolase [Thaumarchaeota archaeon]|nr:TatD family hydrolase [Candidatus Calditenuaceae archaeon]MDW8186755.1 TatD family hydrolase [Nitrososphaerota archaeon]